MSLEPRLQLKSVPQTLCRILKAHSQAANTSPNAAAATAQFSLCMKAACSSRAKAGMQHAAPPCRLCEGICLCTSVPSHTESNLFLKRKSKCTCALHVLMHYACSVLCLSTETPFQVCNVVSCLAQQRRRRRKAQGPAGRAEEPESGARTAPKELAGRHNCRHPGTGRQRCEGSARDACACACRGAAAPGTRAGASVLPSPVCGAPLCPVAEGMALALAPRTCPSARLHAVRPLKNPGSPYESALV